MKKQKYNNGGIVFKKSYKGIGDFEGSANVHGNQDNLTKSLSGSAERDGYRVDASVSEDSYGNKSSSTRLSKKISDTLTVGVEQNKHGRDKYTGLYLKKKF